MSDIEKKPIPTELTDEQSEAVTGGGAVCSSGDSTKNPGQPSPTVIVIE